MYGAFVIDSMPPVTTTSTSPTRIIESAISTARIDDAQTLLIVSAGAFVRQPGPARPAPPPGRYRPLPRGRLADPALQHLAHDHVLRLGWLEADPVERGADRDPAERG